MKTLVNKNNPAIRITAPEIEISKLFDGSKVYWIPSIHELCGSFSPDNWTLVEEEPVDLEKLALEKYPIQMVAKDPFDDEDDTKEDLNEYEREAYLEGLKKGYELGKKGGSKLKHLNKKLQKKIKAVLP